MANLAPTNSPGLQVQAPHVLLCTTDEIPGYRIVQVFGLVRGNTVRTRNVGVDFLAIARSIVGGEVRNYTAMLSQSREQSLDRLRADALSKGANAVIGMRIATSTVMQGAAEILAYGTAVRVEANHDQPNQR